jgi:hypothetical protein
MFGLAGFGKMSTCDTSSEILFNALINNNLKYPIINKMSYLYELGLRIDSTVQLLPMRLKIICIGAGELALTATIAVFTSVECAMVLE